MRATLALNGLKIMPFISVFSCRPIKGSFYVVELTAKVEKIKK